MNFWINRIIQKTNLSTQEAWWLFEHLCQLSKESIIAQSYIPTAEQQQNLDLHIKQLCDEHMPLAYIIGTTTFLNLTLHIKQPILIPRPETEEWVYQVITMLKQHYNQGDTFSILDIGTGSGCIAIALAHHFPRAQITATDINQQALELAQDNSKLNHTENITFLQSDLFAQLPKDAQFDLIVSNPPYIDPAALQNMPAQVTQWEDHQALFANNQGLKIIGLILANAATYLKVSDLPYQLILEIDQYHAQEVLAQAQTYQWDKKQAQKDSFNNWRTLWCKKTS